MSELFLNMAILGCLIQTNADILLLPPEAELNREMTQLSSLLNNTNRIIDDYSGYGWAIKSKTLELEQWLFIGRVRYQMLNHAQEAYDWQRTIRNTDKKSGFYSKYQQHLRAELDMFWYRLLSPSIN